jgi:hypothetical protein
MARNILRDRIKNEELRKKLAIKPENRFSSLK